MTTSLRLRKNEADVIKEIKDDLQMTSAEILRIGLRKVYEEYKDTGVLEISSLPKTEDKDAA